MADGLKLIATSEEDRNRAFIDQWTPAVLAVGAVTGLIGLGSEVVLFGLLGFEIGQAMPATERFLHTGRETLANKTGDVLVFMFGHWCGRKIRKTWQ